MGLEVWEEGSGRAVEAGGLWTEGVGVWTGRGAPVGRPVDDTRAGC